MLRVVSFVQIVLFLLGLVASFYVYLIAPVKETDAPNAAQSAAFCALAISSAGVLLAGLFVWLRSPKDS